MTDSALMVLFSQQVQRLQVDLSDAWQSWFIQQNDAALQRLQYTTHLLKGAALTVSADALAQALHALEGQLQAEHRLAAQVAWQALMDALQPWLVPVVDEQAISLAQVLRRGFAAQARLAQQSATLHLLIDPEWHLGDQPSLDAFLQDALPALFANALSHGGEPEAVRVAAGKAARLQVFLRMRAVGKRWQITLTDDGRGLPRSAEKAANLLTGRGWGVAAVRARVAQLAGGRLQFRARAGVGSVVRICCARGYH